MTALVFVSTAIIPQIPIPFTEGYIHTGDSMIFVTSIFLGWKYGVFAGGIGSAMADLFLGYAHWALPTLIIKSIMGAIVGLMAQEVKDVKLKKIRNFVAYFFGIVWIGLTAYFNKILSNIEGTKVDNSLIEELGVSGMQELLTLINKVQMSLLIVLAIIPIIILIISILLRKKDKDLFSMSSLMGITLAGLWMVIGYYIFGGIIKGNMIVPIFSVPLNVAQFIVGAVIAFPIILALKRSGISVDLDSK